jgi:tetratricopeptide (TPR) repeat protein
MAELDMGRFDEAKSDLQQAIRLSPHDPLLTASITSIDDAEFGAGRLEAAIAEYRKSIDAGDRLFWNYANLAAAYALLGKMDEAKPFVAETLGVNPDFTFKWFQDHTAYVIPKRDEGLRKAGLRRSSDFRAACGSGCDACRSAPNAESYSELTLRLAADDRLTENRQCLRFDDPQRVGSPTNRHRV